MSIFSCTNGIMCLFPSPFLSFSLSLPLLFGIGFVMAACRIVSLSSQTSDRYSSETGFNIYVLAGHENTFC